MAHIQKVMKVWPMMEAQCSRNEINSQVVNIKNKRKNWGAILIILKVMRGSMLIILILMGMSSAPGQDHLPKYYTNNNKEIIIIMQWVVDRMECVMAIRVSIRGEGLILMLVRMKIWRLKILISERVRNELVILK